MQAMMDFVSFFVSELPSFLMTEPISAFTGLMIMFFVARLFERIIHI